MAKAVSKATWRGLTLAIGIPVGMAMRRVLQLIWGKLRPGRPPRGASDPNATWQDALGWAAVSAAGITAAQMATNRSAATLWRGLTGKEPPSMRGSRFAARWVARATTTPLKPKEPPTSQQP